MRIGILTLPPNANYGGILQAYALQNRLEKEGHNVVVFDKKIYPHKLSLLKKPFVYFKRFIKKYLLGQKGTIIFQERELFKKDSIIRSNTQKFINKYIHRYVISSLKDIDKSDFDAIVVGSDQVWRMVYFKSSWETPKASDAFLGFTKGWDILRISYAASFGTDKTDVSSNEIEECKNALALFKEVSVREDEGVSICKNTFGINAIKVLDPTLLLTKEDYLSLINNKQYPKDDKPILAKYILDETPEIEKSIQSIAKKNNYIIKDTNLAGWGNNHNIPTPQISVEDWLYTFSSAKLIINDSFHATVFSILFHKSFVVIVNQQRGTSRIRSLLNMFGLEDRMVTSLNDISNFRDIDYKQIDLKLDKLRMNSLHFLQKYLKD